MFEILMYIALIIGVSSAVFGALLLIVNSDSISGLDTRGFFLLALAAFFILVHFGMKRGFEWKVTGKEYCLVSQNEKSEFKFRYISTSKGRFPLVEEDNESVNKMLKSMHIGLGVNVNSLQPGDTAYCYNFTEYFFDRPTGHFSSTIHASIIPSYEFDLFRQQSGPIDTAIPIVVDTKR